MRAKHALVWIAPLVAAAPFVLAHCGGSNSTTVNHGDSGVGTGSGSGGGSGGGNSSGGASSSGAGDDSGGTGLRDGSSSGGGEAGSSGGGQDSGPPPIPVPEGGAPSTPGLVSCGAVSCTTSSQHCCVAPGGDAGATRTCEPYNGGNCPANGITLDCLEAADCASGVCCAPLAFGPQSTTCRSSCGTGNFQVCRTDSECAGRGDAGGSGKCVVQVCTDPRTMVMTTVEACAAAPAAGQRDAGGALPFCVAK
jgi:hypothetical protein